MFVQRVGITSFVVRWLGAQAATPYKGHVRHAICMAAATALGGGTLEIETQLWPLCFLAACLGVWESDDRSTEALASGPAQK